MSKTTEIAEPSKNIAQQKDDLSILRQSPFADAVKKLEEFMSQSNRAFLLGAGCSACAGLSLTTQLTQEILNDKELGSATKDTLVALGNHFSGSKTATIEDYMSEIVDVLAIAERRKEHGASQSTVEVHGSKYDADSLLTALNDIKRAIANCIDSKALDIINHRGFVKAVHRTLRSGKAEKPKAVDYFILNYDTLIEDALALEKLSYVDGFHGGATGWWGEENFQSNDASARVLKLHGSIDWCSLENDTLPRRIRTGMMLSKMEQKERFIIWPAATKYRETQRDPFAQLLKVMRNALRPGLHSEVVLTVCGYGFRDSHINAEIENALRESDKRLTLLVFTESDQPQGRLEMWFKDPSISDQVRIHAKRGFFHGATSALSDKDLPWWKFETFVRLLEGER